MKKSIACFILFIAFSDSFSQTFSLSDTHFTVGSYLRRYNLYFELGKADIQAPSYPTLDSIADFMMIHQNLMIEIGVHSDSRGSDVSNRNITQARAKSIKDYLVQRKVPEANLKATGYGESKLLVRDEQINNLKIVDEKERQHQLNRRVEFKIIAIN